ncbi:MAG TPA: pilus assembly protein [Clostridia bacterium]|nr:pilus assembly protein [Clostridia bacterium]
MKSFWSDKKGQSLVELALVLPILLMLLLGIVEFGRIYGAYLTISHAAREGARHAAVGGNELSVIETVQRRAAGLEPGSLNITVTPGDTRQRGEAVRIVVGYPVPIYAPIFNDLLGNTFWVEKAAEMRVE